MAKPGDVVNDTPKNMLNPKSSYLLTLPVEAKPEQRHEYQQKPVRDNRT